MGTGGSGGDRPTRGLAGALIGHAATVGLLVLSIALAIVLIASLIAWKHERDGLEDRIAELTRQGERSQALWKAQLSACHAASGPRRAVQAGGSATGDEAARRLLAEGPEGIDVCARMESADQAVLSTLK